MLQTAAGYRALLARGDKGQYKVSIGMYEPTWLLLLDALPLICSQCDQAHLTPVQVTHPGEMVEFSLW